MTQLLLAFDPVASLASVPNYTFRCPFCLPSPAFLLPPLDHSPSHSLHFSLILLSRRGIHLSGRPLRRARGANGGRTVRVERSAGLYACG